METLFAKWTPEIQQAFNDLSTKFGSSKAARMLEIPERRFYSFRRGSRFVKNRGRHTQKFVSIDLLNRVSDLLERPELLDIEALTRSEWMLKGDWLRPNG